jgi:hypothetical protein
LHFPEVIALKLYLQKITIDACISLRGPMADER